MSHSNRTNIENENRGHLMLRHRPYEMPDLNICCLIEGKPSEVSKLVNEMRTECH